MEKLLICVLFLISQVLSASLQDVNSRFQKNGKESIKPVPINYYVTSRPLAKPTFRNTPLPLWKHFPSTDKSVNIKRYENEKLPRYIDSTQPLTLSSYNRINSKNPKEPLFRNYYQPLAQDRFEPQKLKKPAKGYNYKPPPNANPDLGPVKNNVAAQKPPPPPPQAPPKPPVLPPNPPIPPSAPSNPPVPPSGPYPPKSEPPSYLPPSGPPSAPDDGSMDMKPPPPPSFTSPDEDHHHHHHDHPPNFDHYPEIIFDHDHDHYFHHDHPVETTTPEPPPPPPPPEEPPEPEHKRHPQKIGFYRLGDKLWHLPLFFTFFFLLYVKLIILRSLMRKKVQYPTHYVARNFGPSIEEINELAMYATKQIDNFVEKYLK